MNGFWIAWVVWLLSFCAIQATAFLLYGPPATLSGHVWRLYTIAPSLRYVVLIFLGWLIYHWVFER